MGLWNWLKGLLGSRQKSAEPDKPLISLVLLLREPRFLDADVLRRLAGKAFGREFGQAGDGDDEFVVGEAPAFIMRFAGFDFLINAFPIPYVEDVEEAAKGMRDVRLRKAFREHAAWLSVDLLGDRPEGELPKVYRYIGKLTAELADTDCLVLYSPATGQMMAYDATLEEGLRGPDPIKLFDRPPLAPVIELRGDEPEMVAAVEEARRRWPEFVDAFERRQGDAWFSVKAPVSDGEHTEFMWLAVTGIENDVVFGTLDNDPVEVRRKHGDRVRVPCSEINDWIFRRGDQVTGGFTIAAIEALQKKRRQSD